jgi:predicted acylesterase/phospholipase RssA
MGEPACFTRTNEIRSIGMESELERPSGIRDENAWNGRLTAWLFVVHETILPLVIACATVAVFVRLDQAHEALFGTIGQASRSLVGAPRPVIEYIGSQFYAFAGAIALIGAAVWYSSRLLLTVDAENRPHLSPLAFSDRYASSATEVYPRLIGAAASAALVTALIIAQEGHVLLALLAPLLPLAAAVCIVQGWAQRWRLLVGLVAASIPWFLVIASRPGEFSWPVIGALSALCYLPSLLYAGAAQRRFLLRKLGLHPPAASANLRFTWAEGVLRLLAMGAAGGALLLLLSAGPPAIARVLGSAAIVLLSITASLCTLCALTLVLRRLSRNTPGIVVVGLALLLAAYLLLHATLGWSPFQEDVGREKLAPGSAPPASRQVQSAAAPDIVVNAYGGGLRSALFTAQILAELDDRSCGEFGRRLERLSGVSGGSLGLAAYMVLRQEFVASGGWIDCKAAYTNLPQLALLVEDALIQDHLSAVLTRMLSSDLVPYLAPRRGQALLDSWQDAITSVLSSRERIAGKGRVSLAGLALPLRLLSGGIAPAPAVYFNATDVRNGQRFWFSNRGTFGSDATGILLLPPMFQVGQAVLHSARFPVVSPAGVFFVGGDERLLVDGGYADNSGASTLLDTDTPLPGRHWLNIDGNPPDKLCAETEATPSSQMFSGLDALLAVRQSQAGLAVNRYRQTGEIDVALKPNLDLVFKPTIEDDAKRCEFIKRLHREPLTWYLTPVTVGDQSLARSDAVNKACDALRPLCGQ